MSWDLDLKERKVIIEVTEIIERYPEYTAGFPGMKILDQNGREHIIAVVDFPSYEWDKIDKGTKIELTIREQIANTRVVS